MTKRCSDRLGCELVADALRADHSVRIRVTGTSMLPAIWPGAIIQVARVSEASIGDVLLFRRGGRLFAHRAVDRRNGLLVTRGDSIRDCDPPVSSDQLLGRVAAIIDGNGIERPVGSASIMQRALALLIRHSEFVYRLTIKSHNLRERMRAKSPIPLQGEA